MSGQSCARRRSAWLPAGLRQTATATPDGWLPATTWFQPAKARDQHLPPWFVARTFCWFSIRASVSCRLHFSARTRVVSSPLSTYKSSIYHLLTGNEDADAGGVSVVALFFSFLVRLGFADGIYGW
jgi:hypothetical protein